jgi:hypothetical protein
MATRTYYVRYTSPWSSIPFGVQFQGAYIFSVPQRIIYRITFPTYIDWDKKNTFNNPVVVQRIDGINYWGGALHPLESPSSGGPYGVIPACTYRTLPDNSGLDGSLSNDGNLYYSIGGYSYHLNANNSTYCRVAETKQEYVDCGWANDIDSIDSLRDNLITFCSNNLQYTFKDSPMVNALWESVNIVIDRDTWKHIIYIGNDPLATYSTSVADTNNAAVNIASLEDYT